jgi:hypothetical protein
MTKWDAETETTDWDESLKPKPIPTEFDPNVWTRYAQKQAELEAQQEAEFQAQMAELVQSLESMAL